MFSRLDISLLVPGLPFDGRTLETRSLGGSESAGIYMARALAREGARLMVFCNTPTPSSDADGVQYVPAALRRNFVKETPHDVSIVQRGSEPFGRRSSARLNMVWCHDLAGRREQASFRGALWNVDRVVVLSRFMRDQYKEVYGLDDEAFLESRNGIDQSLFRELARNGIARDRKKLIYAARPERGLDLLLRDVMPRLLARDPELRLYIAGYEGPRDHFGDFDAECEALSAELGDRVVRLGSLTKRELAAHYLSAGVYLYPTPSSALPGFREVSCISAMECQAAGLPIVTSRLGALPETIAPGAGVLLDQDPSQPEQRRAYVEQFSASVLRLVADDDAWRAASDAGLARARDLDWSDVAKEWLAEFERLLRAGSSSRERLVREFCRRSDLVAAECLLERAANDPAASAAERQRLSKLLERASSPADGAGRPAPSRSAAERFLHAREWLAERGEGVEVALHYPCGDGRVTRELARELPDLRLHGVDGDRDAIAGARRLEDSGEAGASFSVWAYDSGEPILPAAGQLFDCVVLDDALAGVREPWKLLERVERQVRLGGDVYLSVPFGPREPGPRRSYWSFDAHDLRDMLGSKPGLQIEAIFVEEQPTSGDPVGFWRVSYGADHAPVTEIDVERHLWLQRPRHSVSAAIIAGPGAEETLHWTLRSIRGVCDEIVIADCGMSDEARRIASQYDVRLIAGVDPKQEGFETARNLALNAGSCDWCLWLDTDEKLVGAESLSKYLRENSYHCYGLKQHHFTCDGEPSFEVPPRLFRRRPYHGKTLRFWGAIHELPELALNEGAGPSAYLSDVHIAHLGYVVESVRRERFRRNLPLLDLDRARYPGRLANRFYLLRESMNMVRYALRQNGGRIDDAIKAKCREIVAIYRAQVLGTELDARREGLRYYSEALGFLGEGFEVALHLEADRQQAAQQRVETFRFASSEDLQAVLTYEVQQKAGPCELSWW